MQNTFGLLFPDILYFISLLFVHVVLLRGHMFQTLAPIYVTKIVRFDGSAVFESFWYKNLAPNRAAFYSVTVSVTSSLSMCHRW